MKPSGSPWPLLTSRMMVGKTMEPATPSMSGSAWASVWSRRKRASLMLGSPPSSTASTLVSPPSVSRSSSACASLVPWDDPSPLASVAKSEMRGGARISSVAPYASTAWRRME